MGRFLSLQDAGYETMAAYAKAKKAFLISDNNFFFFVDLPRGYLRLRSLPLEGLREGLINVVGPTYFRGKFLASLHCIETGESLQCHR